jgi:hypothetical protein
MSNQKPEKRKSDKTAPVKTPKEKKAEKIAKKNKKNSSL